MIPKIIPDNANAFDLRFFSLKIIDPNENAIITLPLLITDITEISDSESVSA